MKILHVYHIYPAIFGGASNVVFNMTEVLSKRSHSVTLFTTDAYFNDNILSMETEYKKGITVYRFPLILRALIKYNLIICNPRIISYIKNAFSDYEVIHLHGYRTFQNILIYYYAKKNDIPYMLQAHGTLPRNTGKQSLKWIYDIFFGFGLLRHASKVIALSRIEAQQYRGMGVPEEKIAILPNGIDLSEYAHLPPRGTFKKKFGIKEEKKIVLYLGRIHKIKGIDFLIKSFAYLIDNGVENVKLVIAGPDDGYLYEARSLVSLLGIDGKVLFTGMLSEEDKVNAYVDSTICAYLSPYEPFGLVTLEAAASYKPVIVADGTVMSEIVKGGGFGFSVRYGDICKLAETMGKMLTDTNLSRNIGQKGRKYVFENFDWAHVVAKLEKVYRDAVQ